VKSKIPFKKTHDLVELYHKVKETKDLGIDEILLKEMSHGDNVEKKFWFRQ